MHKSLAEIAKGQLDAYNKQDIDDFMFWYAEDVEIYNFPNELVYKGREKMRERYISVWSQNPNQRAKLINRMCVGNTVMDQEHVTGRADGVELNVIAIYKIVNNKIQQIYFVR